MGKSVVLSLCIGVLHFTTWATSAATSPKSPKEDFAPLDITPFRSVRDVDPKLVAFRTFGKLESPQPEGLKSESVSVSYSVGKAVVTHTITGVPDDAIAAFKYRLELSLVNGKWQLTWAGRQQKCRKDKKWTKGSC
ncbi:MAG: hypothetical protein ACK421_02360 [Pseudanabaenaceae cyanobacterium]